LAKQEWDLVNVRNLPAASAVPLWNRHKKTAWILEIQSPPLHGGLRATFSKYRTRLDALAFHHTLVHSQAVLEDYFGHGRRNVSELPIGVDFEHFRPGQAPELRASLGYQPHHTIFLYSGVISPKRTLHKLIEAFEIAHHQLPDLRFMFLGEGSDVPHLQQLTHEKGLAEYITFLGYIPYQKMPEYMRVADIGLAYVPVVSWFNKAPVLKTMESIAAGLPTIATATQGNHAYIQHGHNGFLVEDNPNALAQAMIQLAQDKALQEQFRRGRQDILKYNWPDIVDNFLYPTYLRVHNECQKG
jgi:glycosyltransferase involved in cell wall biosynthesis